MKTALKGLLAKRWCTDAQCVWIMQGLPREPQWPVDESAGRLNALAHYPGAVDPEDHYLAQEALPL